MSRSAQAHRHTLPYCHRLACDLPPSVAARFVAETFPREGRAQQTIVDAGCGEGRDTVFLLREGFRVIAVDVCERNLRALCQKFAGVGVTRDRVEVVLADLVEGVPIVDVSVDAVLDVWVLGSAILYHDGRAGAKRYLEEVGRILRPAGIFVSQFETLRPSRSWDGLRRYFSNLTKGRFTITEMQDISADYALYLDVPTRCEIRPAILAVATKR